LPALRAHWQPSYGRYIEPFAGSAALFFELRPSRAVLGDTNHELILTYIQVKENLQPVLDALSRMRKSKALYLTLRSQDPSRLPPAKRAARFIYLNRFSFNGLYRTNRSGAFNVPYGGERCGDLPSTGLLTQCSLHLQRARVLCADFETTLKGAHEGDFVYIDPPFSIAGRRVFKEYSAATFGDDQVDRLRHLLLRLESRGAAFLLSYADSSEGELLARGFHAEAHSVRRNIAGFAGQRAPSTELLIFNRKPLLPEASHA
jgi:DNA adenine methylase